MLADTIEAAARTAPTSRQWSGTPSVKSSVTAPLMFPPEPLGM